MFLGRTSAQEELIVIRRTRNDSIVSLNVHMKRGNPINVLFLHESSRNSPQIQSWLSLETPFIWMRVFITISRYWHIGRGIVIFHQKLKWKFRQLVYFHRGMILVRPVAWSALALNAPCLETIHLEMHGNDGLGHSRESEGRGRPKSMLVAVGLN